MVRTTFRSLLVISLALLAVTAGARTRQTHPADLAQARRLVGQSRQLIRDAHRRDPHGFGGHEAKAAELLRRAALQLNEARTFRIYNADRPSRPVHRATRLPRRHPTSKAVQQRVSE